MPTPSKGVRKRNLLLKRRMAAARKRGLTWGQIAMKYGRDRNNVRRTVIA